jgi:hypothetical protein
VVDDKKHDPGKSRRALLGLAAAGIGVALGSTGVAAQDNPQSSGPATQRPPALLPPRPDRPATLQDSDPPQATSFPRLPEETSRWQGVLNALSQTLRLTSTGNAAGDLAVALRRIESGFAFVAQREDSDFSFLHIEPLLDQAADLLDRGIRDRASADDQTSKMAALLLEIHEFAELDRIHHLEEAAGLYDYPHDQSRAEADAESRASQLNGWYERVANSILTNYYTQAAMDLQSASAQKAAWVSGLVPYTFQNQNFGGYVTHTFGGVAATAAEMSKDAAFRQSYHRLFVDSTTFNIQKEVYAGAAEVADLRLPGLRARAAWDAKNRTFARERTRVSRRIEDIKARLATDPDGVLNYARRVLDIKNRFQQDFRDALARLKAIERGLILVYGYDDRLPSDETSLSFFDDCLLWTRRAIQWLIRFSRQEQSFIVPVSVRTAIGDKAWSSGRKLGRWEFEVNESDLQNLAHVRLRGIGATAAGEDDVMWKLMIEAPKSASVRHLDGNVHTLDQSAIPACRLARVTERQSKLEPDVVGVSALHNASPFGKWVVTVLGAVPFQKTKSIDDIVVDLHLAYRSTRGIQRTATGVPRR